MPHRSEDRSAAVEAAVALLAQAMHESHAPVEVMGGALERMTRTLQQHERTPERARTLAGRRAGGRELAADAQSLGREIALCIESLQFHDRLMQQLAQVRECLAGLLVPAEVNAATPRWLELRDRIAARLASDSQRALLDLLVPPGGTHAAPGDLRKINMSEGSIELF